MAVYYKHNDRYITIVGKTYIFRDLIKSLGGKFIPGRKVWMIPLAEEALAQVDQMCQSSGGGLLDVNPEEKLSAAPQNLKIQGSPTLAPLIKQSLPSQATLSISELVSKVEQVITNKFSLPIWITGEIQAINKKGEHLYLTLAENPKGLSFNETIAVNGTLWGSSIKKIRKKHGNQMLTEILQEGLKVCLQCQVSFFKSRSSLSLNILDFNFQYTKGSLALEREETLRYLRQTGAHLANKQFNLNRFPLKIGLISAPSSRAYSDFMDQLGQANYPGEVLFAAASMQGKNLLEEITKALDILNENDKSTSFLTLLSSSISFCNLGSLLIHSDKLIGLDGSNGIILQILSTKPYGRLNTLPTSLITIRALSLPNVII